MMDTVDACPAENRKLRLQLTQTTQSCWLAAVLAQFDDFLSDHASCEKKASGMALSIAAHYPDKPVLVRAMSELAVEELSHYREVTRLLLDRGVEPGPDTKDPYIHQLNRLIRRGSEFYLTDRLLIAAIVERRGHERFGLVAEALPSGSEKKFFQALTLSEKRHHELFLELAELYCPLRQTQDRLSELCEVEGELIRKLPCRAALH